MLWYYKNKQSYLYPSHIKYTDDLTELTRKKHYENSQEDSIIPSLMLIKQQGITNAACIVPIEDLSVNYGVNKDVDFDFCDKNEIPYFFINRKGGAIVLFPGNIAVDAIFTAGSCNIAWDFLKDMVEYLKQKAIDAYLDGNDLMVSGKKVIGAVGEILPEPFNKYVYTGFSISINTDVELINQICTKPMEKIPGALSDYGITTEEVINWLLEWFNAHQYTE